MAYRRVNEMSKTMTAVFLAAGLAGAAYAQHEHHMDAGKKGDAPAAAATVKGEVVDMACYMSHEGKGDKHASCAKACLMGGAPAGILGADGSLTLLLEDHDKKKPYKAVLELAGKQAEVTGKKVTKGGITGLVVAEVKKG